MNEQVEKYVNMQRKQYVDFVAEQTLADMQNVIAHAGLAGYADETIKHTERLLLQDYDYTNSTGLEFGCGIGRLIKAFRYRFKQLDGVDLSPVFLQQARIYGVPEECELYQCNGYDLSVIPTEKYDFIYSAWVMEHICVHEIRNNYFKEFLRVLKSRGRIRIMMQGGDRYRLDSPTSQWYDNYYDAPGTNSVWDVRVENLFDVTRDLTDIGYYNISFDVGKIEDYILQMCSPPTHPGHQFGIVIEAVKA